MKAFTRSVEFQKVVFSDGTKSEVRHQLKNGISQMYWYYVKSPCGGWCDFDIRGLVDEKEIPKDCILTEKSLPFLSELLSKKSWEDFRKLYN